MKFVRILVGLLKLVIWVTITLSLAIGGFYIYSQMKDWNKDAQLIASEVQKVTGRQLYIKGGIDFKFFPRPTLTLKDVKLDNIKGASTDAFITAPQLIITPGILAFVMGDVGIDDLTLVSPSIALEALPDGRKTWDLTAGRTQSGTGNILPLQITLKNAYFKAYNKATQYETKLMKVSGVIVPQGILGAVKFEGEVTRDKEPIGLKFETGPLVLVGSIPVSFELKSGPTDVAFKGALQDIGSANAQYNFAVSGQMDQDLLPIGQRLEKTKDKNVKISAQITGRPKMLSVSRLRLEGESIVGDAEGSIDLTKPRPQFKLNVLLSRCALVADVLLPQGAATLAPTVTPEQAATNPSFRAGDIGFGKYNEIDLLKDADFVFDLGIADLKFQQESIQNVRINLSSVQGGGVELRNLSAHLPREADLEAKGAVTEDGSVSQLGGQFAGNVKLNGASLKQFLKWLKVDLPPIPKDKLNAFAVSANVIFSQHQLSVPAIVARFDDTNITGGDAVVSNDPTKPSQLSLVMENLNLDLYLPKLEDMIKEAGGSEQELQYQELNAAQRKFDFLRAVHSNFGTTDLSFTVNNLIYKGEPVSKASSRIRFGSAQLDLSDIDIIAKNVQIHGKIKVDASGLRPNINADLEVQDFNTADITGIRMFFTKKQAKPEAAMAGQDSISERWSREQLDLRDLQAYDGKAKIYFHSLTHQHILFENVTMAFRFQEKFIYVDNIRANVFDGGRFNGSAVLNVTSQPVFSMSFAFSNAALKDMLQQFFNVSSITDGRFSASGSVSSMGTNIRSIVSRLEGSLNLVIRGAKIEGFDFIALSQSLSGMLGAKEMRAIVDNALRQGGPGAMDYDYAAGGVILSGGAIGMNDLQLLSPNFPPLTVSGNVNLSTWKYDLLLKSGLPLGSVGGVTLRREAKDWDVPVSARIQSPIDNPTIVWDKSGIDRYWEKRFY